MKALIRPEEERDYARVEEVTREAFWNLYRPGCDEHYLVHIMRSHPDYLRELAFVAEIDQSVVGSIHYTKSRLTDEAGHILDTVTFGPVCVLPEYQRTGIGTQLIRHTKELARQKGFPAIIIFGDPHNYCTHGFKTGRDCIISTSEGKYPLGLLVLELERGVFGGHAWKFQESSVYDIDENQVDLFDRGFAFKEKKHAHSQDLFSMLIRSVVE